MTRLCSFVLASFLLLAFGFARADYPAASTTYYYGNPANGCSGSTTTYTDALAAAQACIPSTTSVNPYSGQCASVSGGFCAVPSNIGVLPNIVYSCPSGGTLSGTTCVNGCGTAGTVAGSGTVDWGASPKSAASACSGGCKMSYTGDSISKRALVGGVYRYYSEGTFTRTGETCSGGVEAELASVASDTCASGQTMGQINGKNYCFDSSTGDPVNPHPTETAPDPADPYAVADPLKEFCKENPGASICSQSSFSGTCSGGFVCEGDAAQCAASKALAEMNCKLANDSALTSAALLTATGTSGSEAAFNAAKTSTSLSSVLAFNTRSIAAASCPAPYTVAVLGETLEFSYQIFCDLAGIIGVFVMLGAMVLSARIVVGGL